MNGTCIDISVSRVGTPLSFIAYRIGEDLGFSVDRVSAGLDFSVSLVCSVGKDKDGREVFMVKEGVFLLEDGKIFRVIKEDGWLSE